MTIARVVICKLNKHFDMKNIPSETFGFLSSNSAPSIVMDKNPLSSCF